MKYHLSIYLIALISVLGVSERVQAQITPTLTYTSAINATDGEIALSVIGGIPPYSFAWSNGADDVYITGLAVGEYCVTVTDAYCCTANTCVQLNYCQSGIIEVTPAILPETNSETFDGMINIAVNGGVAPYTFSWYGPGGYTTNTQNLEYIPSGLYYLRVQDAVGCVFEQSYVVSNCQLLTSFNPTVVITQPSGPMQNDGAIDISVPGFENNPNIEYSWTTVGDFSATTQDINNLRPAVYFLEIKDPICGLTETYKYKLTWLCPASINATVSVNCYSGTIDYQVSGGTLPYNYQWNDGVEVGQITSDSETLSLNNLASGQYCIKLVDATGCTQVHCYEVSVAEPLEVSYQITLGCGSPEGVIDINTTGGTPPFQYLWTNNETTEDLSYYESGHYGLFVTDAQGCETDVELYAVVGFNIPTYEINSICDTDNPNSGAIDITVDGGIPPYEYWWSNDETTEDISGLETGWYSVQATDATGCIQEGWYWVDEGHNPFTVRNRYIWDATCPNSNGRIKLIMDPIASNYTYQWSNGATLSDITNLSAGEYCVTISNDLGCTIQKCYVVSQNAPFVVQASINPTCNGNNNGSLVISPSSDNYNYKWTKTDDPWHTVYLTEDNNIVGLSSGEYCVTVTDANTNCSSSNCFTVPLTTINPTLVLDGGVCVYPSTGEQLGYLSANLLCGQTPLQYTWATSFGGADIFPLGNAPSLGNGDVLSQLPYPFKKCFFLRISD